MVLHSAARGIARLRHLLHRVEGQVALHQLTSLGRRCRSDGWFTVEGGGKITAGDGVFIAGDVWLYCEDGELTLGPGCCIDRHAELRVVKSQVTLEEKVTVCRNAVLKANETPLRIGARTWIAQNCVVQGDVTIGEDVLLGPFVQIVSGDHVFDDPAVPVREQGRRVKPVRIGPDCWLGGGATIAGGVTLGRGVIVGAGAVVTKDLPDLAIAAGVPAQVLRYRGAVT